MTGFVNDTLRFVIARVIVLLGGVFDLRQRIRIRCFAASQRRLRQKYRLHDDTPVVSYGARVVESIRHEAAHAGPDATFALTSGSTDEPKKILYTKHRLRTLKLTFSDMFARAVYAYGLKRTSLYVFSSFSQDASLTSMLLNEPKLPPYLSTLQAPYRIQQHPAIRALANEYGTSAVRLWILTIANPGVLYATNPSTISTFFDELKRDWLGHSKLIRNWHTHPHRFDRTVRQIARRLNSSNSSERLRLVATSKNPVPLRDFAPAVRAYICWTGGYVKPFVDRLANHLPAPFYRLIPMYSMSTETVETETVFRNGDVYFLPLATGVVYEFNEAGLLTANQLKTSQTYSLVVSDGYGLRRYQTGDLFECRRMLDGLPDLAFVRRRALEYSFIGEKVTAQQLNAVFDQLRVRYSETLADGFLTCVPSLPRNGKPHYKLVLVSDSITQFNTDRIANDCDQLLSDLNCEYKNKRASGMLGPISLIQITTLDFAARLADTWETQFKFLPLYRRTWESVEPRLDVPHLNASYIALSDKNTRELSQITSLQ